MAMVAISSRVAPDLRCRQRQDPQASHGKRVGGSVNEVRALDFCCAAAAGGGPVRARRRLSRRANSSTRRSLRKAALDALRGLKGLAIKADAMHWEPGQSKAADGEPRMLGNTTLTITWDLANGMARTEWDRDMKYPAVEKIKYTDVITPTLGYVIDDKGASKPMSGIRVAATLRELERASPTLLLKALDAKSGLRAAGEPEARQARPCAPSVSPTAARISPFCSTPKPSFRPPSVRGMTTTSRAIRPTTWCSSDWKAVGGGQDRAHAVLSAQRRGGRQGHLQGGDGEPDDRGGYVRGARGGQIGGQGDRQPAMCRING